MRSDFSVPSRKAKSPRLKDLFKAHLIFLMLPGGVNLSHRNWRPHDIFSISCFGSNQGKLPPFLYFGIFHFCSRSGSIEIAWRYLGRFLFGLYYLPYPDESILICPLLWLPALGKEIFSDSFDNKVVSEHHKEESLVLLPWCCTTLYSTSATIFFFKI